MAAWKNEGVGGKKRGKGEKRREITSKRVKMS